MTIRSPHLLALTLPLLLAAPAGAAQTRAFVYGTDYFTGGLSVVNLDTRAVTLDVEPVYSDARLRWRNGSLFVINRQGADNYQEIETAGYSTVHQFSVGNGSNPGDLVHVSDTKAYVSRYNVAELLVVNPTTGATIGAPISLAAFADADGIPEMDHMALVGDRLFVAIQRLDRNVITLPPTDHSDVVVIDTRTDQIVDCDADAPGVQPIRLTLKNPVTAFAYDRTGGRLLLGCVGFYGQLDGGIEAIDPRTLESLGVLTTETTLGGDMTDVEWHTAAKSYAIVTGGASSLVTWNPATGARLASVVDRDPFSLQDCAIDDRGELYLADASFDAPGVLVVSTATDAVIAGPLDTGLPPNRIAFDQLRPEVGVRAPAARIALSQAFPNPATGETRLTLALDRAVRIEADVFDAAGRLVRTLARGEHGAGSVTLRWDGSDRDGRAAAPGIHFVRVRAGAWEAVRRVVVLE